MFKYLKYKFDQALEKSFLNLALFLFGISLLGIILFSLIFYFLFLIGVISIDGVFGKFIWMTFAYFIDVGTISGEAYTDNTTADKVFKILITIFGIIVFSSFIGIISQALSNRIEELREGKGYISEKDHTIIFNFSKKTIPLLNELFKSYEGEKKTIVICSEYDTKDISVKIESATNIPKNINLIYRKGYGWQKKIPALLDFEGASHFIILKPDQNQEYQSENDCDNEVGKTLTSLITSKDYQNTGGNIVAEFSSKQKQVLYEVFNLDNINSVIDKTNNKRNHPLFVESEDIRAKIISQAVFNPDIVEIYDELFSFEGSEIYFFNTKDLNLQMKSKLNKINNKTIFEINSIFDHIICLGSYNIKDHDSIKDQKDYVYFDPEVLWVDLIPEGQINFNEIDGLIFIANNKQKIFDEIEHCDERKDDIKLIEPNLDEFGHKIRIALFAEDVSESRIKKILQNIKETNKLKNVEFIRVFLDESTTITSDNFTEINKELRSDNIELELYSIDYNNWRHEQLYPYTGLSEMLNEFNCYIFAYDDITDDDDNINNVKDNKVIDNYVLFSNFDISNEGFKKTPRSFISEVGAFKSKDILERYKRNTFSPYFGVDIIDINTLISKIISSSSLDKNNKKLIDLFLNLTFNIKTYTVNEDQLETSFCELEKYFAKKKQILLGLIDYDFKDVQKPYQSSCSMPRRKISDIIINPDQRKKLILNKGDRIITFSN
tara:strand:- start:31 stop:2193 length:2163 start_codon:yes stop_codon:yes gene_type:complete